MIKWLIKLLSKKYTKIPLFTVYLDLIKYRVTPKNSCMVGVHSCIKVDAVLKEKIDAVIDYIRENNNMEDLI